MLRGNKGTPFRSASGSTGGIITGSSANNSYGVNSATGLGSGNGSGSGFGTLTASSSDPIMHPNLGLHSASAKGDVGLAKFALENGQPHNSLLNGLLPLHAACSGGSESVVRLLLSYGADINAPRQKSNKTSITNIGLGTEGSTPLHFAAANGRTTIVKILLESGANPSLSDKDGVTPEAVALAQNHQAIVSILRNFISSHGNNGLGNSNTSANLSTDSKLPNRSPRMNSSPLRAQRSFESLSSAAAGVKATLKHHKKQALAKVSSNPNLKSFNTSSNAANLPPLPTSWSNRSSGLESTKDNGSAHSTPPGSLTFGNGTYQHTSKDSKDSKDSKRRPSLPSIFEKATPPASLYRSALLTNPSLALSHPIEVAEDEEVASSAGKRKESSNLLQPPSTSPSRPAIRLPSKKSLTGLFSKASGSTNDVVTSAEQGPTVPLIKPTTTSMSSQAIRNRSRSSELLGQSPFTHVSRSDGGILSTSFLPPPSVDRDADGITKSVNCGPVLHPFRPRKSSNLTSASSPLLNQVDQEENKMISSSSVGKIADDQKVFRHGRKRSQSATSIPKRPSTSTSEGEFTRQIGRIYGSHYNQFSSPINDDDSKEILYLDHQASTSGRSKTPTRFGYQRTMTSESSPRINQSPLNSSRMLNEDQSKLSSSPSLGPNQRTLHSQNSNSSLISSTTSSHLAFQKVSFNNPSIHTDGEGIDKSRSYHSLSQSEKSLASKTSSTSLQSFIGLSSHEQAQAILRIADDGNNNFTSPINLTQMLAAYGEALAQERGTDKEGSKSIDGLHKQTSTASLSSLAQLQTPGNSRDYTTTRSDASLSPVSNRRQAVAPATSTASLRMDQAMPRVSRSSSSLLGFAESSKNINHRADVFNIAPSTNKHQDDFPSAKIDSTNSTNSGMSIYLTGDENPATLSSSTKAETERTIVAKQSSQPQSTNSEFNSNIDKLSIDTASLQTISPLFSESEGARRRQASDLTSPDREREEYKQYQINGNTKKVDETIEDESQSPIKLGKHKGTVKAFLSGIKSNVVK